MYTRETIRNALLNWGEIEGVDYIGATLDLKCDMEMALERLYGRKKRTAYTLLLFGEYVIINNTIHPQEVVDIVEELYQILNVEGLKED